jgi:hypothetical protein
MNDLSNHLLSELNLLLDSLGVRGEAGQSHPQVRVHLKYCNTNRRVRYCVYTVPVPNDQHNRIKLRISVSKVVSVMIYTEKSATTAIYTYQNKGKTENASVNYPLRHLNNGLPCLLIRLYVIANPKGSVLDPFLFLSNPSRSMGFGSCKACHHTKNFFLFVLL